MNSHTIELLRELRPGDAERVDELFPAERRIKLLAAIVSGSPAEAIVSGSPAAATVGGSPAAATVGGSPAADTEGRWRVGARRRRLLGSGDARLRRPLVLSTFGAVAAGTVAAVVLSTTAGVGPEPADAVAFRTAASGDIIATVTDPFAARAQLDAAFAKQGLKVKVNLLPVSPSIVGTVLYVGESGAGDQIKALQGGHCLMGGGGCSIGLDIPKDFTGEGSITLGRPAKAGEQYEGSASIFAPGEPLHCSGLLGAKVSTALPVLQADNLTVVQWREDVPDQSGSSGPSPNSSSHSVTDAQPPVQNYIWDAELIEPGKVRVTTASTPWPNSPGAGSGFNKGC
jgi:hypothetical protein